MLQILEALYISIYIAYDHLVQIFSTVSIIFIILIFINAILHSTLFVLLVKHVERTLQTAFFFMSSGFIKILIHIYNIYFTQSAKKQRKESFMNIQDEIGWLRVHVITFEFIFVKNNPTGLNIAFSVLHISNSDFYLYY